MHNALRLTLLIGMTVVGFSLAGCWDDDDDDSDNDDSSVTGSDPAGVEGVNPDYFVTGALVSPISTEACTLSGGTETTCYRIEVTGVPADQDVGPFCPSSIYDDADQGGIWFDCGGEVYELSGDFFTNLSNLYGDSNWLLYDQASGDINVTTTQEACEGAAQPNVEAQYQNHCVQCSLDYVDGGVTETFLIPVSPSLWQPLPILAEVTLE